MRKVKVTKSEQDFKHFGKPWWQDRNRKYTRHEATDIMKTFKRMGWIPPSEVIADKPKLVKLTKAR